MKTFYYFQASDNCNFHKIQHDQMPKKQKIIQNWLNKYNLVKSQNFKRSKRLLKSPFELNRPLKDLSFHRSVVRLNEE